MGLTLISTGEKYIVVFFTVLQSIPPEKKHSLSLSLCASLEGGGEWKILYLHAFRKITVFFVFGLSL